MKTNYSQADIKEFLSSRKLAIAGISRDEKKFSRLIMAKLKEEGVTVLPINPNAEQIDGQTCYSTVSSLPPDTTHLFIVTNKKDSAAVLDEAIRKGIRKIWIQQGSETPETLKLAQSNGVNLISGECMFMWMDPVGGFHKFHRLCRRIFGGLPS